MPIRTAVIGFGVSGRVFHAPLVAADPAFDLRMIVTADPARAAAATAEYPSTRIVPSPDDLFAAAADLDLVVIGSPNSTHLPLALRAVSAGLDVVTDKPVTVRAGEARSLIPAADEAGRLLTVFQNRRWDGDFLTISEMIRTGRLGQVHQFETAFEWWKPELGAAWKDTTPPGEGGGILYDLGPHLIDQCLQLFGPVEEAHAELDRRRQGAVSDDDSFVTLHHGSGVRSRLWMSAVAPAPRPRFRVVGSRAVATVWGLDPQEAQLMGGQRPNDTGYGIDMSRMITVSGPEGEEQVPVAAGDYPSFYAGVAAAITNQTPAPVDAADAAAALSVIETAASSHSRLHNIGPVN
ncbi:Gfo/Idh/MocA family oxidoreductase [Streptomyces sp. NBC_01725]|uniref:Gfo/Idh/MocA family oxidoreductase n=1 Tax=Streptomyces sp. NBC_01725 TaxID=2975923 RepID=UPI002E2AB8F5|nr:Gfo/Idh/MocA family oxidoreductase [Streptomyces sp. NBC_01725]